MKVGGWGGTHRDERELEAARLCRNNAPSRVGALHFAAPSSGCHQHEAPGDAAALFFFYCLPPDFFCFSLSRAVLCPRVLVSPGCGVTVSPTPLGCCRATPRSAAPGAVLGSRLSPLAGSVLG